METLTFVLNCLKVVLGLGFVIFLHELGHFLVAKWCGVYVKSFSIGFPPTIIAKKWGETTYKIGLLFLGGYVSMLGEGTDTEDDPEAATNPRSFRNKSAGARIAILSAGVIMNIFLGLGLFMATHLLGVDVMPARIGGVAVGSPAYAAGIRAGDEITAIDGDRSVDYQKLKLRASLSSAGRILKFEIKRPGVSEPLTFDLQPKRAGSAEAPTIGVMQGAGLELALLNPFEAPVGLTEKDSMKGEFKGWDRILAVGPVGGEKKQLKLPYELDVTLVEFRDKPLEFVVERSKQSATPGEKVTVTVPPSHFAKFGFRNGFGPIKDLQGGSIAQKAGFQKGDLIVKIDGKDDFDPFDLPTYCYERAGKPISFVVKRPATGSDAREIEITATPDRSLPWVALGLENEPFDIPGLGLALEIDNTVVAVTPGSAAAQAGVTPGLKLKTVELILPKVEPGQESKPINLDEVAAWPYIFEVIQRAPKSSVRFGFVGKSDPVTITPVVDPSTFHPYRGLGRIADRVQMPPQPIGVAFQKGLDDTYENVISIYAMIRSLFQGRVSPKNLAGLPRIGGMAYQSASAGIVYLMQFLAMLSINLAVINFMPIPPLDGGQISLILAEKVRGRPVPPAFFNAVMIAGFVLIVALMLFTNGQDIILLIKGKG